MRPRGQNRVISYILNLSKNLFVVIDYFMEILGSYHLAAENILQSVLLYVFRQLNAIQSIGLGPKMSWKWKRSEVDILLTLSLTWQNVKRKECSEKEKENGLCQILPLYVLPHPISRRGWLTRGGGVGLYIGSG
jgi:hypothetical protein